MARPPFTKRFDNPAEQAWREGKRPGEFNRLGANPSPIGDPRDFANAFVRLKGNPDRDRFYSDSQFPFDVAEQSQQKINAAAASDQPSFADPRDNDRAVQFLNNYRIAAERGLIEQDRMVSKESLGPLTTQPAKTGQNETDPNTVGKFPNQGVSV